MNDNKKVPDSFVPDRRTKEYPTELGSQKFEPNDIGLFKIEKTSKIKKYYSSKFDELNKQFEELVNEIKINERLYLAKHNFEPITGETYHLYKKEDGQEFLSLLSPNDWKKFEFIGSYKFLSDGRWEEV